HRRSDRQPRRLGPAALPGPAGAPVARSGAERRSPLLRRAIPAARGGTPRVAPPPVVPAPAGRIVRPGSARPARARVLERRGMTMNGNFTRALSRAEYISAAWELSGIHGRQAGWLLVVAVGSAALLAAACVAVAAVMVGLLT